MPARAQRRHHQRRMKVKPRKLYPQNDKAKFANHLAVCSCWMCGNPRKVTGEKTIQERKYSAL